MGFKEQTNLPIFVLITIIVTILAIFLLNLVITNISHIENKAPQQMSQKKLLEEIEDDLNEEPLKLKSHRPISTFGASMPPRNIPHIKDNAKNQTPSIPAPKYPNMPPQRPPMPPWPDNNVRMPQEQPYPPPAYYPPPMPYDDFYEEDEDYWPDFEDMPYDYYPPPYYDYEGKNEKPKNNTKISELDEEDIFFLEEDYPEDDEDWEE